VFGDILQASWETDKETSGAWLKITLPREQRVEELWILPKPLPYDLVLDPYMRGGKMATPRRVTCTLSGGESVAAELRASKDFQIIALPTAQAAKSVRITINDTWPEPKTQGTGLGKVRVFGQAHSPEFEVYVYTMYDVRDNVAVQSAAVEVVNPGAEIRDASLQIRQGETALMNIPLGALAARSVSRHNVWIPAPFEDETMDFGITDAKSAFKVIRRLRVPAYHSYFDGGTFDFFATNHNDLGWLDTQQVTADYRSAELILPAMELIKKDPSFRYSTEAVIYLTEFLDRHPEKREEMAQLMRERKFVWGGSYVENLEVHVGPEKLVRQFYLGRRWLRKNFPDCDSYHYCKTDPPSMTWQMPQILTKAGIKYVIQGRFPWGFYNWAGPDGSSILVFAFRYADPHSLPNPKGNQRWLSYAAEREDYYAPRRLPRQMIFDFNGDYLPPPPSLLPYVPEQNAAMQRFTAKWNAHYQGQAERQIQPPHLRFVEAEGMLDDLTKHELNIETVRGDWPLNWAYYDEPGHRAGLLDGRLAHNRLLAAERLSAGLLLGGASGDYPAKAFEEAWKSNCWPDHGWGGNRGVVTDSVYVASYAKCREQADQLISSAGSALAGAVPRNSSEQITVAVYNSLAWKRTDVVQCKFANPSGWGSFALRDSAGRQIPYQLVGDAASASEIVFLAEDVPSVGYKTYYLESASESAPANETVSSETMENDCLRTVLGAGGLKSLYDMRLKTEILKTDKFFGGEVLQFTAPGLAWDGPEVVTMADFDKTSNHEFNVVRSERGPVMSTIVRETRFQHFRLRQSFRLSSQLDRVEMDVEILDWDGPKARELRVAFPINLPKDYRLSYEVPFGTVEVGKDEVDFSALPTATDCQFSPSLYGGDRPLPFREAINWIDASSGDYEKIGCLAASDCTVHLFEDQTDNPVTYPVLQHVLLSSRKSQAWNPDNWFTQEGSYRFRMALYPHGGAWTERYRDGIAFNYPLLAFVATGASRSATPLPASGEFLRLEPANLVMTALKKNEDDDSVTLRFFEAEGRAKVRAHVKLFRPIRQAWKTNLIEEEPVPLTVNSDGIVKLDVRPWEIVTLKLQV
jgi:alpha-mannosidase